jgi:hypothetical protein
VQNMTNTTDSYQRIHGFGQLCQKLSNILYMIYASVWTLSTFYA